MTSQPSNPSDPIVPRSKQRGMVPPELMSLIVPPLQVGSMTGTAGIFAGVAGAIARDTSPFASGIISGAQWFTIGSTFWFTRSVTIRAWGNEEQLTPMDRVKISTIAGSTTGALTGLLRGPSKILPAVLLWGAIGAGGQLIANRSEANQDKPKKEGDGWLTTLSPLKKLTDQEYLDMMNEKILRVEADMALIDDRINELKSQQQQELTAPSQPENRS